MTRVLIVRAHPLTGETSKSMKVTDVFVNSYKESNPDHIIEDINLYKIQPPHIDSDLLLSWNALGKKAPFSSLTIIQQQKITLFNYFTELFLATDKIIVANPLWNLNVPSHLKSWFDTICVAEKTFKYTEKGSVGMAGDKKALHIQASGGVYNGQDPASLYVKKMFDFLGITNFQQLSIEGMDHFPDQAEQIMASALTDAAKVAKLF